MRMDMCFHLRAPIPIKFILPSLFGKSPSTSADLSVAPDHDFFNNFATFNNFSDGFFSQKIFSFVFWFTQTSHGCSNCFPAFQGTFHLSWTPHFSFISLHVSIFVSPSHLEAFPNNHSFRSYSYKDGQTLRSRGVIESERLQSLYY